MINRSSVPVASEPRHESRDALEVAIETSFSTYYQRFTGDPSAQLAAWRSPDRFQPSSTFPLRSLKLKPVVSLFVMSALGFLLIQLGRHLEAQQRASQALPDGGSQDQSRLPGSPMDAIAEQLPSIPASQMVARPELTIEFSMAM